MTVCARSAVSLGRRRPSVSGGDARGALENDCKRRSVSSSLRAAGGRSGGRAGLGGGLRCPRVRSGRAWRCQSAAATHSLTAPAGARRPQRLRRRLMRSKTSLSSNVYAVSHGAWSPKARVAGNTRLACLPQLQNQHPSLRTRVHPAVIGVVWKLHAHRETEKTHFGAARCISPSEHSSEPPHAAAPTTLNKQLTNKRARRSPPARTAPSRPNQRSSRT